MNKESLFWLVVTLAALGGLAYLLGVSDGEPRSTPQMNVTHLPMNALAATAVLRNTTTPRCASRC